MEPLRRIEVQRIFLEKGFQSIKDWAEKRGFSRYLVYKVLEGVAVRGKKGRQIVEALLEDFGACVLHECFSVFSKECRTNKSKCEDKNGGQRLARKSKKKRRNGYGGT